MCDDAYVVVRHIWETVMGKERNRHASRVCKSAAIGGEGGDKVEQKGSEPLPAEDGRGRIFGRGCCDKEFDRREAGVKADPDHTDRGDAGDAKGKTRKSVGWEW
jgi:hypothetical protein